MKKITTIVIAMVLFSACAKSTKESKPVDSKLSTNTEKSLKMKKVLFVLTSHDELGNTGNKTGFWIEEFAAPLI